MNDKKLMQEGIKKLNDYLRHEKRYYRMFRNDFTLRSIKAIEDNIKKLENEIKQLEVDNEKK